MKTKSVKALLTASAMIIGLLGAVPAVPASADDNYTVINVSADSGYRGVQNALDMADTEPTDKYYKVVLEKGTYTLDHALHIYNNTYLDAGDATIQAADDSNDNLLKVGLPGDDSSSGYYYSDITIDGGHWNRGGKSGTTIKLAHAKNVTVKNAELYNTENGHLIETAGVDGLTIDNCNFHDATSTAANQDCECIQIDILVRKHFVGYQNLDEERDYVSKNISVTNCKFRKVAKAVGSHTAVYGNPFTNVNISNNTMTDITGQGIQVGGMQGVTISNNTISSRDNCINMYVVKDTLNGNYLSKTKSNKYNVPAVNATISNNSLTSSKSNGIYIHGTKFRKSRKGDADTIPAGSYPVKNVKIIGNKICTKIAYKKNKIDTYKSPVLIVNGNNVNVSKNTLTAGKKGYNAVYIKDGSKKVSVTSNKITGKWDTAIRAYTRKPDPDKYGPVQISSITGNTINNSGDNGIVIMCGKVGSITKNKISGCSQFGIRIDPGVTVNRLAGNRLSKKKRHDNIRINKGAKVRKKK